MAADKNCKKGSLRPNPGKNMPKMNKIALKNKKGLIFLVSILLFQYVLDEVF